MPVPKENYTIIGLNNIEKMFLAQLSRHANLLPYNTISTSSREYYFLKQCSCFGFNLKGFVGAKDKLNLYYFMNFPLNHNRVKDKIITFEEAVKILTELKNERKN